MLSVHDSVFAGIGYDQSWEMMYIKIILRCEVIE